MKISRLSFFDKIRHPVRKGVISVLHFLLQNGNIARKFKKILFFVVKLAQN